MKKFIKLLLFSTSLLFLLSSLQVAQSEEDTDKFAGEKVKIGTVGDELADIWEFVADKAAEEGIELEIILFTDYNTPNISLVDGSLDMNAYQHSDFLKEWNDSNNTQLTSIGTSFATPLRFFSEQHSSIDDLPEGATIAIPNDLASSSYALQVLDLAGIIKIDDNLDSLPTINNIVENPSNFEIVELEAAQIPATMPDIDMGVIHQAYLESTDFEPNDAIFSYGHNPETFNYNRLNTITVRAEDQDNPLYQHIVDLYQSQDVADYINEISNGGHLPAWILLEEYEASLEEENTENETSSN